MRILYIYIISTFCIINIANAQNWRKDSKMASQLAKEGKYAEAAEKYESAWKDKNKKTEFIEKAGDYFAVVRDYKRAAEAYRNIKDNYDYPMAKYYFARALKQDGQYTEASREFAEFINSYKGKDRDAVVEVVQNEIKGCELAQQLIKTPNKAGLQFSRLNNLVNTQLAEFAPIPYADDILYFSSTISGKAAIYRTQKSNGTWSKPVVPNGIPSNKDKNICNGTFSVDGKRFFYTECGNNEDKELSATCKIYVIVRKNNEWSSPIKLSSSINVAGANVSQPFATQIGDKEILYFISDAVGGIGKTDIWQTSRNVLRDNLEFSTPVNLGAVINSAGDDISPYFDISDNTLYYSSNGHITMGGLDIFKSTFLSSNNTWSKPENLGLPYNSNADDYYFVKNKTKMGGFVVSNRVYGKEKTVTTNEDIFEFASAPKSLAIKGKLLQADNSSINDARATLYEVMGNNQKRLLQTKLIPGSEFEFALLSEKKYRIDVEKKGYKNAFYEFSSAKNDSTANGFSKNFVLEIQETPIETNTGKFIEDTKPTKPNTTASTNNTKQPSTTPNTKQPNNTNNSTKPTATSPTQKPTPEKPREKSDVFVAKGKGTSVGTMPLYETIGANNERLLTSAPKQQGIYYKIQVTATKDFDWAEPQYRSIRDFGRLDTEYIIGKGLHRVLLADFFNYDEVLQLLPQIQQNKEFKSAYIVKYQDGKRIGTGK